MLRHAAARRHTRNRAVGADGGLMASSSRRCSGSGKAMVSALNGKLRQSFPYCYAEVSRHGKVVLYFRRRKGGPKIRIHSEPFSTQFHIDYASARQGVF